MMSENEGDTQTVNSNHRDSKLYRGRAPIASMDAMEDMEVNNGSNTVLAPDCQVLGRGTLQGLKYRHVGKSGLKVVNIIFHMQYHAQRFVRRGVKLFDGEKMRRQFFLISCLKWIKTPSTVTHPYIVTEKVSNIALGSLKAFGSDDKDLNEEIITLAFENGINFFDISEPFTSKKAEAELGRIIKKKGWTRRQFTVATKIYWDKTEERALSRKEILESVKDSLANLQLEYIDLLVIHKYDPQCPIEEILRAVDFLINSGKILYWGTAKWSPVEIFECISLARSINCIGPICEYAEYHPFHREKVELYMAELYNKVGLGLITWSPVSLGLLLGNREEQIQLCTKLAIKSGKYKSGGDGVNGYQEGMNQASHVVKQLDMVAERLGCTLCQLLLAWSLRNNTSQILVLSANSQEQLANQLASLQTIHRLKNQVMDELDRILGNKPVRQPMVSTLQQRWTATGAILPQ